MGAIHDFVAGFRRDYEKYRKLEIEIKERCEEALSHVEFVWRSRVKSDKSLQKKLEDRAQKYRNENENVADIKDLVGGRIILARWLDFEDVERTLNRIFNVKGRTQHPKSKRNAENLNKRFRGYDGLHFHMTLQSSPKESSWNPTFEIQVMSGFMWNFMTLEHDIEYKELSGKPSEETLSCLDLMRGIANIGEVALQMFDKQSIQIEKTSSQADRTDEDLENVKKTLVADIEIDQNSPVRITSSDGNTNLDRIVQNILVSQNKSQITLTALVQQCSEQTQGQIKELPARIEKNYLKDRFYCDVRDSLFYPDIFSRQEQIAYDFDGMEDSYDWVFQGDVHPSDEFWQNREHNEVPLPPKRARSIGFSHWLTTGNSVYWINGKAGSGKSTLMLHIYEHKYTKMHLKQWSGDRLLLTPAFFSWNAGGRQSKTIEGMLRSLIYQMLTQCPNLIECFKEIEPLHAWTSKRLLTTLSNFLTQNRVDIAVCIFIDGLDEFEGDYMDVVNFISSKLSTQQHVKVCMSSRPLPVFQNAFGKMQSLRLQDLTYDSIRGYTRSRLLDIVQSQYLTPAPHSIITEELIREVVARAEGVFLWVVIAVRSLREGLQGCVDPLELRKEIDRLPAGVESLYARILSRVKPMYRQGAARFLQILIYEMDSVYGMTNLDILRLHLIYQQTDRGDVPLERFTPLDDQKVDERCAQTMTQVSSHTLGLLDVIHRDFRPLHLAQVRMFHKTTKDFLVRNDKAKAFLEAAGSEEYVRLSIARGTFAYVMRRMERNQRLTLDAIKYYVDFALDQISCVENLTKSPQIELMESIHEFPFRCSADLDIKVMDLEIPNIIPSPAGPLFDIVATAASHGMVLLISEICGLSGFASPTRLSECPISYRGDGGATLKLKWSADMVDSDSYQGQSLDEVLKWWCAPIIGPPSFCYRQQLGKALQWCIDTQSIQQAPQKHISEALLLKSYFLACCVPTIYSHCMEETIEIARRLLAAGANPLVHIESSVYHLDPNPKASSSGRSEIFWATWLKFLRKFSIINNRYKSTEMRDKLFEVTKAMLAQGAPVDYQIQYRNTFWLAYDPDSEHFRYAFRTLQRRSAMSYLKTCFCEISEFQEFMAAVECTFKRPWSRIVRFYKIRKKPSNYHERFKRVGEICHPNKDENDFLLDLLGKYEIELLDKYKIADVSEGSAGDDLRSGLEQIWQRHQRRPGIEGSAEIELTRSDDSFWEEDSLEEESPSEEREASDKGLFPAEGGVPEEEDSSDEGGSQGGVYLPEVHSLSPPTSPVRPTKRQRSAGG